MITPFLLLHLPLPFLLFLWRQYQVSPLRSLFRKGWCNLLRRLCRPSPTQMGRPFKHRPRQPDPLHYRHPVWWNL